jgi:hypothetical protein
VLFLINTFSHFFSINQLHLLNINPLIDHNNYGSTSIWKCQIHRSIHSLETLLKTETPLLTGAASGSRQIIVSQLANRFLSQQNLNCIGRKKLKYMSETD